MFSGNYPLTIRDEADEQIGVALPISYYREMLRLIAQHTDWEALPSYLQDAIDNMLVDEAEVEDGEFISLEALLADDSIADDAD